MEKIKSRSKHFALFAPAFAPVFALAFVTVFALLFLFPLLSATVTFQPILAIPQMSPKSAPIHIIYQTLCAPGTPCVPPFIGTITWSGPGGIPILQQTIISQATPPLMEDWLYCQSLALCPPSGPPPPPGQIFVQMSVREGDGTVTDYSPQPVLIPIMSGPPNTAPSIILNGPASYHAGDTVEFDVKVSDREDDPAKVGTVIFIKDNGNTASYWTWDSASSSGTLGVTLASSTPDSRTYHVRLACGGSPPACVGDLVVSVTSTDPSGLFSAKEMTISAGDLPPPAPFVQVVPASPVCPASHIRATATQPSGSTSIQSHSYTWSINGVKVQSDTVQDMAKTGITSDSFDCSSNNCQDGQTVDLEVVAIGSSGLRSISSTRSITVTDQGAVCTAPSAPVLTSKVQAPYPFSAIVSADQTNLNIPAVYTHRYVWKMADSFIIDQPPQPVPSTLVTSSAAPCSSSTPAYCAPGGTIALSVYSYTALNVESSPATLTLTVPARPSILAPISGANPLNPYDTDSFTLTANNPDDEVDKHQYKMELINADGSVYKTFDPYDEVSTSAADLHTTSSKPFACTIADCRGRAAVITARAFKSGSGWSDWSYYPFVIHFAPPPIPPPELAQINPVPPGDKMLSDIKSGLGGLIEDNTKTYTFTVRPKAGQPPFDGGYKPSLTINDVSSPLSSAPDGNGNLLITLACSPTSCPSGTIFTYTVIGVQQGADSAPLVFLLVTPTASGMPAQVGVICDGAQLQRWMQVMAIGMMALLGLIALVYMFGSALHHPQLLEWSKSELGHVGMTVIFFFLIVWMLQFQCNLNVGEFLNWAGQTPVSCTAGNLCLTPDTTMTQAALKSLEWGLTQTRLTVVAIRYEMGVLNMRATYSSYATQFSAMGGNGYSFTPLSGDYTLLGSFGMLLNLNSTFIITLIFELFSLFFFSSSSGLFIFLIPIGLILRSVPFMRGFGGSLVALGFGFYFFYPIILAFSGILLAPIYHGMDSSDKLKIGGQHISDIAQLEAAELGPHSPGNPYNLGGTSIFSYNPGDPYPRPLMPLGGSTDRDSPPDLGVYFNLTALNFLRSVLIPTAGLIVTVSFVRDLAAIFGEEVDASKLIAMI